MKILYNKATDSVYIHLTDKASVDSDEVTDGVVLDFDANKTSRSRLVSGSHRI